MFGSNEIVGRKTFKAREDLLVTSMFYTLQGEGPLAGQPSVFLRLAKCNLACSFCDTYFDHGDWMDWRAVVENVLELSCGPRCNLIVTGGEPLLQAHALRVVLLMLRMHFRAMQVETNGLLSPEDIHDNVMLVVSPKCHEGAFGQHYLKPHAKCLERARCLKFVVTSDQGSGYHKVPDWAFDWREEHQRDVYVSPMNEYARPPTRGPNGLDERNKAERISFWEPGLLDLDKVRANHEYAAKYALDNEFNLSLQMQLFASIP